MIDVDLQGSVGSTWDAFGETVSDGTIRETADIITAPTSPLATVSLTVYAAVETVVDRVAAAYGVEIELRRATNVRFLYVGRHPDGLAFDWLLSETDEEMGELFDDMTAIAVDIDDAVAEAIMAEVKP